MTSEADNKFPKIGAITIVMVVALLVYSVKLLWQDAEHTMDRAAELCRSIVPALHVVQLPVKYISTEVEDEGATIRVFYRLEASGRNGRRRWMMCSFNLASGPYGEPQLEGVETDIGRLGEGRLFVIRRWWLEHQDTLRSFGEQRGRLNRVPV